MELSEPVVALFGYESSPFTLKVRLALRLKQIPYTFVTVPSMMPRPILRDNFHLTYRKIPVLAIGRELYCDTSLILEALEQFFPASEGYQTLYPPAQDGRNHRALIRGFASHWTDRALFRVTTGLIPASVWRGAFGRDRAQLIGHRLDADKLEGKLAENLGSLDTQLSLLEPLFVDSEGGGGGGPWIFSTRSPSHADIALYYQLEWGREISSGRLVADLTGGDVPDSDEEGTESVFNPRRYPGVYAWYRRMQLYFNNLGIVEDRGAVEDVLERMRKAPQLGQRSTLVATPRNAHASLSERTGLMEGMLVSVVPDDTGRDDPTFGTLVALSPEEVVIRPRRLEQPPAVEVRIHFPRIGFVIRPLTDSKL